MIHALHDDVQCRLLDDASLRLACLLYASIAWGN